MKYNKILVRYGDLTLKGKNKKKFIRKVVDLIKEKLNGLDADINYSFDRVYLTLNQDNGEEVIKRLGYVSGIHSYSLVYEAKTEDSLEDVKNKALELVKSEVTKEVKFKVETKRTDKSFLKTSIEISQEIASYVLRNSENLHVDVHNPDVTLHIELQSNSTYLYLTEYAGLGGYPVGIAGKGILMLSGGIDSPVAGFFAMKQGLEIECLHYESTPLTSIESAQKVIDLVKKMAYFAPNSTIKIHFLPFKEIHMALLDKVDESYNITIMRRMMYRIASRLAPMVGASCIVNGESLGQVASQTLKSMETINSVTCLPVLRPLVTYDKNDIIKISRKIDTYDISIKPFEDCCTVYVPKQPATAPTISKSEYYEKAFDYETMIDEAIKNIKTVEITPDSDLDLSLLGLEVRNVL